jgi:cobalamin biosynthesis Mg chelatase CobN
MTGQKVRDLRTWLTSYSYWNQGGLDNVLSMFLYLAKECFGLEAQGAQVGLASGPFVVLWPPHGKQGNVAPPRKLAQ